MVGLTRRVRGLTTSTGSWSPPADWLSLPADAANKIAGLVAVFGSASNFIALTASVSGGYTVDWGDGTVDNVATGVAAEHEYTFSSLGAGTTTTEGFRQAIVVITPQVGGNAFTSVQLHTKHSQAGLADASNPWLDIRANLPSATSFAISGSTSTRARFLRRVELTALGAVTNASNMFLGCGSLASLIVPAGFGAAWTNGSSAFNGVGLRYLSLPSGFGAAITNATNMFANMASLYELSLPSGFGAAITTTTGMFTGTASLRRARNLGVPVSFTLPAGAFAPAELNEVYTALPTVTAQTITVTGNWGTTGHNALIATAKGWAVLT